MVVRPALGPLRRWDPERIGPYVLLGRLGAGAMGQVFLGRSTAGRLVAVKTIKIEFAEEAGFRARFAHEVAAARRSAGCSPPPSWPPTPTPTCRGWRPRTSPPLR